MESLLEKRIKVANLPTPIQKINSKFFEDMELYIKRDDFTGSELGGNKIRKLEYIFADVIERKYDTVVTCGGLQSNHARTTAYLAAASDLNCHLILADSENKIYNGNYLLNSYIGAKLDYVPEDYFENGMIDDYLEDYKTNLISKGLNPYIIPLGASTYLGNLGYIRCVKEIKDAGYTFDRIVVTVGSGGTYAGLLLGIKLFMPQTKLTGINVRLNKEYFINHILKISNKTISRFDLDISIDKDDIDIIEDYVGDGYGKTSDSQMMFVKNFCAEQGILLDGTYTGKCMYGLYNEYAKGKFKDEKVLWIHTGGLFGVFGNPDIYK